MFDPQLLAIIVPIVVAILEYLRWRRMARNDATKTISESSVKLATGYDDLLEDYRQEVKELRERLQAAEAELKKAHRIVDKIENGNNNRNKNSK